MQLHARKWAEMKGKRRNTRDPIGCEGLLCLISCKWEAPALHAKTLGCWRWSSIRHAEQKRGFVKTCALRMEKKLKPDEAGEVGELRARNGLAFAGPPYWTWTWARRSCKMGPRWALLWAPGLGLKPTKIHYKNNNKIK